MKVSSCHLLTDVQKISPRAPFTPIHIRPDLIFAQDFPIRARVCLHAKCNRGVMMFPRITQETNLLEAVEISRWRDSSFATVEKHTVS